MSNPEIERLANARYVSLTTYRRDGTAVATPVWVASEEGYLLVLTDADSGKVKRLGNDPRIEIAPCDARGSLLGDPASGRASVIHDGELVQRGRDLIRRRYGWQARVFGALGRLRGSRAQVVLAISLDDTD